MNVVMTRQQYLDNSEVYATGVRNEELAAARHRTYYGQFVTAGVKQRVLQSIGLDAILQSKDPHFNDIPLAKWDVAAFALGGAGAKMKEAGDYLTKAGAVCIVKEAAKQLKEEAMKQ
jgi:hypothetical protein